jgi:hypothetical protein
LVNVFLSLERVLPGGGTNLADPSARF